MFSTQNNLFLTLLFVFSAAIINAAPQTPKMVLSNTSNKTTGTLAAWRCILEGQLTLKKHAKNSRPWAAMQFYKKRIKGEPHRALILSFVTETIAQKLTPHSGICEDYGTAGTLPTFWETFFRHLLLAAEHIKEFPSPIALTLYGSELRRLISRAVDRGELLNKIRARIPCIESRSIPKSIKGSEYIVVEGDTGYLMRNLPHLIKTMHRSLKATKEIWWPIAKFCSLLGSVEFSL